MALTARTLLSAYAAGVFPMSESRTDPDLFWVDPKRRGIIPLEGFRISRSLARVLRRDRFHITIDTAFDAVVDGCADRDETWINPTIRRLYGELHRLGHGHSVEVWDGPAPGAALVGGVYGVTLGAAFFGESMFSRQRDASKVALAYLVDRLRAGGFALFDVQFLTDHLASLGAIEVDRSTYGTLLELAIRETASWEAPGPPGPGQGVVQRSAQTS
ncbi:leucyl/phenylalanyl-tRNA--protein transferase [Wenxinia saemankumensis]|uniref:Leucyl/phenylalanyl-tRNA--protein transferase n=1 Tax=Wenxinia saemankumensis TaxID=1447782 RepID=A0A1M6AX31_9RHOB|nr:leucyl/phenylalanyl-tRNA--protein transferase [Wenxinia saemankumensis]SHI41007.1 leucyl/phenylalanyl-tRNA--protein transferase [Wenxinia saemankumensis]